MIFELEASEGKRLESHSVGLDVFEIIPICFCICNSMYVILYVYMYMDVLFKVEWIIYILDSRITLDDRGLQ